MPWHYVVRTQGEDFAARFQQSVWVDASTGTVTATIVQPWYLQAISLARPIHFDNHDTLPLKILWFVTDSLTCFMIITGIYAWWVKFRPARPVASQHLTPAERPVRPLLSKTGYLPPKPLAIYHYDIDDGFRQLTEPVYYFL